MSFPKLAGERTMRREGAEETDIAERGEPPWAKDQVNVALWAGQLGKSSPDGT